MKQNDKTRALLRTAIQHYSKGEFMKAIEEFKRLLNVDPDCAEAYGYISQLSRDIGEYDTAVISAEKAVALDHDNWLLHGWLGEAYFDVERFFESASELQKSIELYGEPTFPTDVALSALHFSLALSLYYDGDYKTALEALQDAELHNWSNGEIYALRGEIFSSRGEHTDAIHAYRRAFHYCEKNPAIHFGLANEYFRLGAFHDARYLLETTLKLKPDHPEAQLMLGYVYDELHLPSKAERSYRKAIKLDADCFPAYAALAIALHKLGKSDDSRAVFEDVLKRCPDDPEALCSYAEVCAETDLKKKALSLIKRIDKITSGDAFLLFRIGVIYYTLKCYDSALKLFDQVLDLDSIYENAYYYQGLIHEASGDKEKAISAFREAINCDPSHAAARQHLDNLSTPD